MNVKITYDQKELQELAIAKAVAEFGDPPEGKDWVATPSYGAMTVELYDKTDDTPPPAPAAVCQPIAKNRDF